MKQNYKTSLAAVLKYEGGYVNNPNDPGGATNKGITQGTYNYWRKKNGLPIQSVKNISQSEVEAIYKKDYWDAIRGDDLPSGLDLATFDFAVNSGVGKASKSLEAVLKRPQDGKINDADIQAAFKQPNAWKDLCNTRLGFLKRLSTWKFFGKGWGSRVADVKIKAAQLASSNTLSSPSPVQTSDSMDVKKAQQRLASLSYPLGAIDGKIGALTRSAIRDFQDANDEPVTGNLDQRTYDLLMSDGALKRPVSAEREALTVTDLKDKGSTIVVAADKIKANITTAGAALAGASGVASQINDAASQVQSIKDAVQTGHESVGFFAQHWQIIVISVLVLVVIFCIAKCWQYAGVVEQERLRQAQTGENLRH
jgi:lysozyme family protein